MHVVICPLVSRDLRKAIRCVNSVRRQLSTETVFPVCVVINSLDEIFVNEMEDWCRRENVEYTVTLSNGTPARGKNKVLQVARLLGCDGISLLDGDDLYYPTACQQIERHLRHHPSTDVLIVKPSDQLHNLPASNSVQIGWNVYATLWGTHDVTMGYPYGPGQHALFSDRHAATNLGGHAYYSRRAIECMQYDEDQLLGEDLLLEFDLLKRHQQGDLEFWLSFASDVQLLDRTGQTNVQAINNAEQGERCYQRLVSKVQASLDVGRSSFNELPVEFPPLLFSYAKKVAWLRTLCDTP